MSLKENINDKIKQIIVEIEPKNRLPIDNESNLIEDLWFDSLSFVELLISIESEFKIDVHPEELVSNDIQTINDLTKLVFNIMEEKGGEYE